MYRKCNCCTFRELGPSWFTVEFSVKGSAVQFSQRCTKVVKVSHQVSVWRKSQWAKADVLTSQHPRCYRDPGRAPVRSSGTESDHWGTTHRTLSAKSVNAPLIVMSVQVGQKKTGAFWIARERTLYIWGMQYFSSDWIRKNSADMLPLSESKNS